HSICDRRITILLGYHEKRRTSVIYPLRSLHPGLYTNGNFFPVSSCQGHALIEIIPVKVICVCVFVWLDSIPVRSQGNALHVWVCQCGIRRPIMWRVSERLGTFSIHNPAHWGRLRLRIGALGRLEQSRGDDTGAP